MEASAITSGKWQVSGKRTSMRITLKLIYNFDTHFLAKYVATDSQDYGLRAV